MRIHKHFLALGIVLTFILSSCVVAVPSKRGHGHKAKNRRCHPSKYWDGRVCRHKGKAKGHHKKHKDKKHKGKGKHKDKKH